jgi:asparagine synthase (glutamine-hydrolysing)
MDRKNSNTQQYKVYLAPKKNQLKIISLFKKFKENCVHHIDTEFPFVIYNENKKNYFAACDPIGIKPLYYCMIDSQFYFSKELKTLFQKTKLNKEVNVETLKNIINNSVVAYDQTMYKGIKRLPPGHYMYVTSTGQYLIERYWKPEEIKINYKITEDEAESIFRTLFNKAIFNRIDNLETTGFELSGGLDSSSIVSWIKYKKPEKKITTFSMNFTSLKDCDESDYIDAMDEQYSLNMQRLDTDKMDYNLKYSLENNYKLNPYWPIFITYTMGFSVLERAKELNVKTILTGQGGDHILAGNLYILHEYFRTFQWLQLYREMKYFPKKINILKQYLLAPLLGEKNIQKLKFIYRKVQGKKQIKKLDKIDFEEFSSFYVGNSMSFKYDIIQVLHSSLSVLMNSSYYSVAEEHFGIEFKHPFFDRRLIEFMLSLPPKFKYSEGISKRLLRTAMKGILPEKIRQRTDKAEFSEVLRQQIDAIDLDELFHNANLARLGLVDQKKLDTYKEDYKSGKMKKVVYFWQLINLEYWYRFNFVNDHNMDR